VHPHVPDWASKSLRPMCIEKRSALPFIRNVGGQYKTKFSQRFEFRELSLDENSGNGPDITSKVGFDCNDACRVWRFDGGIRPLLNCLRRWRRGRRTRATEPRCSPLPASRQKFRTVLRVD